MPTFVALPGNAGGSAYDANYPTRNTEDLSAYLLNVFNVLAGAGLKFQIFSETEKSDLSRLTEAVGGYDLGALTLRQTVDEISTALGGKRPAVVSIKDSASVMSLYLSQFLPALGKQSWNNDVGTMLYDINDAIRALNPYQAPVETSPLMSLS